ncbi:MAG: alpha/beta hydrolase [Deltaproteobacteria bacterium]|nr:alpha/beta hydrolase [Deltaproteobacteria bacterium]
MLNNVVEALVLALQQIGMTTLRFNFRGVGASQGTPASGDEPQDVNAALNALYQQTGRPATYLAGYSFGAWANLTADWTEKQSPRQILAAPPVAVMPVDFLAAKDHILLIAVGDQDVFCPLPQLSAALTPLGLGDKVLVIPGADHFFSGAENELISLIKEAVINSPIPD